VFRTRGLSLALAALTPVLAVPLLRSWRMSSRSGSGVRSVTANIAVAMVYDVARALALVAFAGHQTRR